MARETVAHALELMLAVVAPMESEEVSLDDALGRVCAEALMATLDQPPFDASAMDGWAVRRCDLDAGLDFQIRGESRAGRGMGAALQTREAARIFTGAPIPDGADTVVLQEDAIVRGDRVIFQAWSKRNIRHKGSDFHQGNTLVEAGDWLGGPSLSVVAAGGHASIRVKRRPRIAILSVGDELVPAGEQRRQEQIYNSGAVAIAALARSWGAHVVSRRHATDQLESILDELAPPKCDVLVVIGGASNGDYDLVKPALTTAGARIVIDSVQVRPGKPTWFGVLSEQLPVLGLPGNPLATAVSAVLFLKPMIEKCLGRPNVTQLVQGRSTCVVPQNGPVEAYLCGQYMLSPAGIVEVRTLDRQDSAMLSLVRDANALIRRPAGAPPLRPGEMLAFIPTAEFLDHSLTATTGHGRL